MVVRRKSVFIVACFLVMGIVASLMMPACTPFIEGPLAAANAEAEQVKTAAHNFFEDHGVWPDNSGNLTSTGYLAGPARAIYDIDDDHGWLLTASNVTWDSRITFQEGRPGPDGQDGMWVKK